MSDSESVAGQPRTTVTSRRRTPLSRFSPQHEGQPEPCFRCGGELKPVARVGGVDIDVGSFSSRQATRRQMKLTSFYSFFSPSMTPSFPSSASRHPSDLHGCPCPEPAALKHPVRRQVVHRGLGRDAVDAQIKCGPDHEVHDRTAGDDGSARSRSRYATRLRQAASPPTAGHDFVALCDYPDG